MCLNQLSAFLTPTPFTPYTTSSHIKIPKTPLTKHASITTTPKKPNPTTTHMVLQDYPRETLSKVLIHQVRNPSELNRAYTVWNQVASAALDSGEIMIPKPGQNIDLHEDDVDHEMTSITVIATMLAGKTVGAGRLVRRGCNVRLDRVGVLPEFRGRGIGRVVVQRLVKLASGVDGAIWVKARKGEMGFWSIMGFETQGGEKWESGSSWRCMVYRWPVCSIMDGGCVGLHHMVVDVGDIEESLAFYGGMGFIVTEKFYGVGGKRACYVEGLGARLMLVEKEKGKGDGGEKTDVKFGRLMVDVTKACKDLESYLEHLRNRNGGLLTVVEKPAVQVSGSNMLAVATVKDPDGLEIGFFRKESHLPPELRTRVDW